MNEPITDQLVVGVVVQTLFTLLLVAWGRWVARRQRDTRFWRFAAVTPWGSMALLVAGTLLGIVMLMRAFDATKTTHAGMKARILAEGISAAMNASAMFLIPGYALLLFAVVSFVVGSVREPGHGQDADRQRGE